LDLQFLGKRMMLLQLLRRRLMHGHNCERDIVPGQYPLLNYLSNHPDATQQELASMLFVTPASVAQSTKRLQSAGLLEKASDPDNLRKNRLRVTRAGQDVVDNFRALAETIDRQTFAGFSDAEKELLLDMLNRMIRNIATDEDMAMLASMDSAHPHGQH
jgi:DNA-binding MarR family transcriptional regulator